MVVGGSAMLTTRTRATGSEMAGRPGRKVQPTDLGRVVSERLASLERQGVPMHAVAARCTPPVSVSYLSRVGSGTIRTAGPEKLAALAVGLGLPVETLQLAQARPPQAAAPLPCAVAVAASALPVLGPEALRRLDAAFAQQLRDYLERRR